MVIPSCTSSIFIDIYLCMHTYKSHVSLYDSKCFDLHSFNVFMLIRSSRYWTIVKFNKRGYRYQYNELIWITLVLGRRTSLDLLILVITEYIINLGHSASSVVVFICRNNTQGAQPFQSFHEWSLPLSVLLGLP